MECYAIVFLIAKMQFCKYFVCYRLQLNSETTSEQIKIDFDNFDIFVEMVQIQKVTECNYEIKQKSESFFECAPTLS